MRDYIKWIITAIVLIVVGSVMCVISFGAVNFDSNKMNGVEFVTTEYEITDEFENIHIEGDTEDLEFVLSEDGKCSVVCLEDKAKTHNVGVNVDTLTIDTDKGKNRQWSINIFPKNTKIIVCLPKKIYGKINLETDTGNIEIHDLIAEKLSIESDTGNVIFDDCDADTINVKTDTGNVTGTLISNKRFQVDSDTGRIDVPKGDEGGLCTIETDTGNIIIDIP